MTIQARSWKAFATQADHLLASLAFPGTLQAFRDAEESAARLALARRALGAAAVRKGDDSGHDGTTTRHTFDLGVTEWLVQRFPDDVEIDWRDSTASDAVDKLLRHSVRGVEEDGFQSDALSMRDWVRLARGDAWPSDLSWLLDALRDADKSLSHRAAEWEDAALPIVWRLRGAGVLHARLAVAAPTTRRSFRETPKRASRVIASPLTALRCLPPSEADSVIQVARETLAVRCREVHAISYANRDEVWWADLGVGTSIAVIGVLPELRLALEANYGFVLFSNGVPIGYGGVSPLFRQANTGINIFAPFRGTEAGMLWVRALQAFHALFGSKRFIANPFQVGGGNAEAIKSGAFWFYHRIGFRPSSPALAALADVELAHRKADRSYRSPAAILKQLAGADLVLTLPGFDPADFFDERWLGRIALRGTEAIAREGRLPRHLAVARIVKRVAAVLGTQPRLGTAEERRAFEGLAPVVASISNLESWPAKERRLLASVMRAKGHLHERDFVLASSQAPRLFRTLAALASAGAQVGRAAPVVRPQPSE